MNENPYTISIAAGKFKSHCLELMDRVCEQGTTYLITKHGRNVARLVPVKKPGRLHPLRGSVRYHADLLTPIGETWDSDR